MPTDHDPQPDPDPQLELDRRWPMRRRAAADPAAARDLHRWAATMPAASTPDDPPEADEPPATDETDHRRRRRARAGVIGLLGLLAASMVAVVALLALGLPADPPSGAPDPTGAADAAAAGEGPGATIDVAVPGQPGIALGTLADEVLDTVPIDGHWDPSHDGAPTPTDPSDPGGPGGVVPDQPPAPDSDPVPDPTVDPGQDPTQDPGEDPTGDPGSDPTDPCAGLDAGDHLVVTPDPLTMIPGSLSSHLSIRNCGTDAVDWTAATKPYVALAATSGTLEAGAVSQLGFTVDGSAVAGDFAFRIKVSEPGANDYVDVSGTKGGFTAPDPGPNPNGDLTTGRADGCAATCIVRAELQPNASSPDQSIEVETSVAATLRVFVSTSPPVEDPDGYPSFPEVGLIAASDDLNTAWHGSLSPLQPSTDYHIIVRATDADGGVEHRIGTFRSVTPAVPDDPQLAGDGPAGCAGQCITTALVTPDADAMDATLDVESHTPAQFTVYLSTDEAVVDPQGKPSFPGVEPFATSGDWLRDDWSVRLEPLAPSTTYHVIVRATDIDGWSSYRLGQFETGAGDNRVIVTFAQVRIEFDGDEGSNRGEVELHLGIDGEHVETIGEDKIASNTTLRLNDGDRMPGISFGWDHQERVDPLPTARVVAVERDADGLNEFCPQGWDFLPAQPGSDGDCDWRWNVADSGTVADVGELPPCRDLGVTEVELADQRCAQFSTPDLGDDVPRFTAIVAFQPYTG